MRFVFDNNFCDEERSFPMKGILTILLMAFSMSAFAQFSAGCQTDSAKIAEYRERIGLDYSMPDYSIKKIDEKVMGARLANLLRYFEEGMNQGEYNYGLVKILGEQHKELRNLYFSVKKLKLISASKSGTDITVKYEVWPDDNSANVKQTNVLFLFREGVSESRTTNELFATLSRYVQAREILNQ